LSLALWGLFKKVVVADSLAIYTDTIYNNSAHHSSASLLLATYCFALQIYCDFSGYSDMARGVSRVYGIELMRNFDAPYFSRSIQEFWSRWHISLSTWFRDYVYVPLGGNRVPLARGLINIFIVFMLSGFWHGANWTFIVWGALHGFYLVVERLRRSWRQGRGLPANPEVGGLRGFVSGVVTFHLVVFAWVFFRATDLSQALAIARSIVVPTGPIFWDPILVQCGLGVAFVLACDYFIRRTDYFDKLKEFPIAMRWGYALSLLAGIALLGVEQGSQFIYFQF
jgi:D-alanyl-lipoteichoic acid acyltransferase DltB (MBOAT superfamily)